MPIGVPRIIYMWGEDLPAQWTDIYNFIFRRRMVFLMQYLDDELCNQICGLLISIHMEDRSRDLEKKSKKPTFRTGTKATTATDTRGVTKPKTDGESKTEQKKIEDLLRAEDDLQIDENHALEQYTLQKITMDWLKWNAQFFNWDDEPYAYQLAEILSQDFQQSNSQMLYSSNPGDMGRLMTLFRKAPPGALNNMLESFAKMSDMGNTPLDAYGAFRWLAKNLEPGSLKDVHPLLGQTVSANQTDFPGSMSTNKASAMGLKQELAQKLLWDTVNSANGANSTNPALAQRGLSRAYGADNRVSALLGQNAMQALSYVDVDGSGKSYLEYREAVRKQTESLLQEEESKKVFMLINSFGGSVGNGVTVHDALQFIRAGCLTLGLGVAASAASLALAGGTIGERYVTEGCHVMIHQPEGGLNGQASDVWIDSQEIQNIRLQVADIYSLSTYRPRHKILRDLDRDFYLTASETLLYGLADEIASNDVMHEIIQMTSQAWDYSDAQQQRLLETRDGMTRAADESEPMS